MPSKLIEMKTRQLRNADIRNLMIKSKYFLIGKEIDSGLIFRLFLYVILIDVSFIYLKPIYYMITEMIKDTQDLLNPCTNCLPTSIYLGTLQNVWHILNYPVSLLYSIFLSGSVAILQMVSCAVAGYAFARLDFPFKKFWFFCLLISFIVPEQVIIIPQIIFYNRFHFDLGPWHIHFGHTVIPILLPALFGHGLQEGTSLL